MVANIKKEIRFALYCIHKNFQNSAELRGNFLLSILGMMINNAFFILLWFYFARTVGELNGWRDIDMFCLIGFSTLGFGIAFSFFGGLYELPNYIFRGDMDRFILSPKSTIMRVLTSRFVVGAFGDLFFGLVALSIYFYIAELSLLQAGLIIILACASTGVYLGFTTFIYSLAFFFNDGRNICRTLFEVFLTPGLFHGGAFHGLLKTFFTFVFPALLVGAIPTEIVRDLDFTQGLVLALLTCFWLILAWKFFKFASRFYQGTGLMG